ncbi:hypothetical protein [Planobispora longispora]|uniref:Uncharacterized protein n=1 Tax=Planobispora longispora TaxID=28887 RepID=A0A8J3W682_9ACTN|nr:hypothetical protein [Planobispora longispora]BFE79436.1 hypothetical protein GCM10020093_020370 [Planobispora longispora]GIH78229.1 hypothetical protein Plo01_46580 [Planobispora longispora]
MVQLHLCSGIGPGDPDVPVVALVVDRDGLPGERALDRLGMYCHEWEGGLYLPQTDGWAERVLEGTRLVVDVAVYPIGLHKVGVGVAAFPSRSAIDPDALLVLRAEAVVDRRVYAQAAPETLVFTADPGHTPDDAITSGLWPMVLAPPPTETAN